MRIAFIHPRFPSAEGTGATHSATQIVSGLTDAGHDLCVYCPRWPGDGNSPDEMELRHLAGNSNHPHTNTRLNKEVSAREGELADFDVVHSYLPSLIPSVSRIGEDTTAKTVVTMNAYGGTCAKNDLLYKNEEQCQKKSTSKCLNCIARSGFTNNEQGYLYQTIGQIFSLHSIQSGERSLEHIDGFRAPSGHVKDNYVEFGYPSEKIEVIPHPLNDRFLVEHTSDFQEPYHLLYVGSLEQHKGVEKLIPILHGLRQKGIQSSLTIVGTGGLQAKMEKQIKQFNLGDSVTFNGFVPNAELPAVYANHDLFIHPGTWEEPLARVYIEALATGTPIVTREYGTIETIIGPGGVTTDGSVENFINSIESLVQENGLDELSDGGKNHSRRYRRSEIVEDIEALYQSIPTNIEG